MTSFLIRHLKKCLLDKTGIQRLAQKLLMEEEPPKFTFLPIQSSKTSNFAQCVFVEQLYICLLAVQFYSDHEQHKE